MLASNIITTNDIPWQFYKHFMPDTQDSVRASE